MRERAAARVVVYDALTYAGHIESLADVATDAARFRFVRGDVCDRDGIARVVAEERPRYTVHLAAESHVDRSIHDAQPFVRTNVEGTLSVLEAVRDASNMRVVVASTDEVYGALIDPARADENAPLRPSNPYAASKAAADLLASAWRKTFGVDIVVTRSSNVYGPYQMPEKFVPVAIESTRRGEPVPIYGDGRQRRDWVHVDDHCRGLVLAAERGATGETYNIGSGFETENLQLAHTVLMALGESVDRVRHIADRRGHDRRYALDVSKARTKLGFEPSMSLVDGIARTVAWYGANRGWLAAVESESHSRHMQRTYGTLEAR